MRRGESDNERETYIYPVVKILACIALFVIVANRDKIIPIPGKSRIIVGLVLDFAILIGGLCCIKNGLSEIHALRMRKITREFEELTAGESAEEEIEEYDEGKLDELPSMQKSTVKTKLLANGFEFKDGYYRKKQFSFLKGSTTYFLKMADCINLKSTIDRELNHFHTLKKGKGINCLFMLLYLDHIDEETEKYMKTLGQMRFLSDGSAGPYAGMTNVVVVIDRETDIGYFAEIEKGFETFSQYSKLCKFLKTILR